MKKKLNIGSGKGLALWICGIAAMTAMSGCNSDGGSSSSNDGLAASAVIANVAPLLTGTPPTAATVGVAYSFTPTASDADGNMLGFSIQNKPGWATFSTSTGGLNGTPTAAGTFSGVLISVNDGNASASLPAFTITVSAAAPPPTPAPPFPVAGNGDPCQDLMQDKAAHAMTALAKPARGQAVTDPQFGTRIVRITDVGAQFNSSVAKPAYSTIPAWNADETYLILYVTQGSVAGHYLFNGKTYEFIKALNIAPTDIEHFYWSSTDPDILYYAFAWEQSGASVRQLIKYHVGTDQKEVLYNIPNAAAPGAYRVDFGGDPIYSSWNNDLFGFRRRGSSDTGFTYRVSTNVESPRVAGGAPQIAPSGTQYVQGRDVMNATTNTKIRTMKSDTNEHGDITMLENGQDLWVSTQFDVAPYGSLIAENLNTGVVTEIIGQNTGYPYPPTGTHISGHAFKKPGWVAVSVTGDRSGARLLDQELLVVDTNTSKVCRAAHHRSAGGDGPNGYWAEPHVNISPSGTRLLFGSDWGGGSTVDAYVVELPGYQR